MQRASAAHKKKRHRLLKGDAAIFCTGQMGRGNPGAISAGGCLG
ncbi:hypothetical protein [Sphingorhabdus contaminans]|nr:hypothetical protein [Sphingorhabdus contaminans]